MAKITFEDKVALDEQPAIADVNKVRAIDINQIKSVVNGLDDTISNLGTTLSSSYLPLTGGTLSGDLAFSHTSASTDGHISWTQGTYQQRIKIVDNSGSTANTFVFQKSADSGSNWTSLLTIANDGRVLATTFVGALSGNATTATTASKADRLTTGRTLTIGNTGKEFAGNANVSWSLSEIGAAAASHSHSYLPLSGGKMSGNIGYTNGDYSDYDMIKWKTGDANGAGVVIGGGGAVVIGGGESADRVYSGTGIGGSSEVMYICNDQAIQFYPGQQSAYTAAGMFQIAAGGALTKCNGVNVPGVFVQSGTPTAKQTGDIWFS